MQEIYILTDCEGDIVLITQDREKVIRYLKKHKEPHNLDVINNGGDNGWETANTYIDIKVIDGQFYHRG